MAVKNHLLFSEIFFQQIRRETADLGNLRATLSTIQDTWQYYLPPPEDRQGAWTPARPFPADDVAQLRAKVVEQIFAYLQLTYGPCPDDDRAFFLYADWAREDRTGLCLVLPYSAHIEGRDPDTDIVPKGRNYAQQLIRLLRQHDLDWGVLTNGRHWRLYHRTELSPTDTYLHIDLERIIAANDIQNYIVFHRFFSRPAFARQDGRQRLDLYKQQSDEATRVIEKHLSAHVEEIVRHLCQGMVESCRAAGEDVTAAERRSDIYKNALFLVYRLLFVLYAEARDLLPLEAPAYRRVCLRDLLAQVRDNHRHGLRYDDDHDLWGRLQSLFALIDQGNVAAGVPAYNGGLFDPERRPFLTNHRIRNEYLQAALIRLSTIPAKGKTYDQDRDPQPIDYRDLSVRHLGSLYEGLLEYNLFVVQGEERVVRVAEKKTEYVPRSQAGTVRASETLLQIGDVYFSETAGERKATGSYYTPEDVVDYIVRHTVGTKLTTLKADFYATQGIERQLADLADTPSSIPAHRQIQQALDDQFLRFVREKVLALNILDPAMGSGHFLVNATHAVANFIAEVLNETAWDNPEIDTDVATWKRQVAERCIFGVDLNELAVELAKLCLWMTTTAKGKPLTFLDHHLRWGNSLVGAWLKDVGVYPLAKKESKQAFTLPLESFRVDLDRVLAGYRQLYAKSSDDVADVREKARIFHQEIDPALQPYRELLTLHTGIYFGNGLDEETYAKLGAAVAHPAAWSRLKEQALRPLLDQHADRHWFHWELEFPEVFTDTRQGFDVVVGNPPYGESLDSLTRSYLEAVLPSRPFAGEITASVPSNVYAPMLENVASMITHSGWIGYVIPNSSVCLPTHKRIQQLLRNRFEEVYVSNFSIRPQPIFPGVMQRIAIILAKRGNMQGTPRVFTTRYIRPTAKTRATLFEHIEHAEISELAWQKEGYIPKLGNQLDVAIYQTIMCTGLAVRHLTEHTEGACVDVYFHDSGESYWTKGLAFAPAAVRIGNDVQASGWSAISVLSCYASFVVCLVNSTLFYWYWLATSDCRHLTMGTVLDCPIPSLSLLDEMRTSFDDLCDELMRCYNQNTRLIEKRVGYASPEITVRNCKDTIDRIDQAIGQAFGFKPEWIEYLIHYDAECRTGLCHSET
jgi:hypothetical protein